MSLVEAKRSDLSLKRSNCSATCPAAYHDHAGQRTLGIERLARDMSLLRATPLRWSGGMAWPGRWVSKAIVIGVLMTCPPFAGSGHAEYTIDSGWPLPA